MSTAKRSPRVTWVRVIVDGEIVANRAMRNSRVDRAIETVVQALRGAGVVLLAKDRDAEPTSVSKRSIAALWSPAPSRPVLSEVFGVREGQRVELRVEFTFSV